jgi:cysteinyl-tRNA synthetase
MDGKKMAKSAGNFQRVTELVDRGLDPLAFRYLVLTSRYSRKLEYSDRSIAAAAAALESLRAGLRSLGSAPAEGPWAAPPVLRAGSAGDRPIGVATGVAGHGEDDGGPRFAITDHASAPDAPLSTEGRALHDRFVAAIDDDLDMPVALALLREILRADLADDERRWLILDADSVLGLDLERVWDPLASAPSDEAPADVTAVVEARTAARAARDWDRADALRAELDALGWEVTDTPDGPELTRRGPSPAG